MADNVTANSIPVATRSVTYSGDAAQNAQVVGLVAFSGSDDAKTAADIPGSATDGLLVNLGTNNDVTVTGSVTANAGTNLNTSALALESGGNLAAAATSLALIDDPVFADDAAFTVGTSKVKVAGFLVDDASPDVADEGDAAAARMTLDRKQIVMLGESGANLVRGGGSKTDTSDQSIMAASGSATIYNYLCWVAVYNASSTNTYVNVKDGSTVVAVLPLPAYGGAVFNLPVPIRGTGNTAFNLAAGASVTTAYLYGGGYKGA